MAHLIHPIEEYGEPEIVSAQSRELLAHLEYLLLAASSIDALYSRLAEFLLQTAEVDGVWLGAPDEQEKLHCQLSAGTGVE